MICAEACWHWLTMGYQTYLFKSARSCVTNCDSLWFRTLPKHRNQIKHICFIKLGRHLPQPQSVNSLRPRGAYMRQETRSSLLQIMACRLFGAKPLSEPILEIFIGLLEANFSEILIVIHIFSFMKMRLKKIVWITAAILSRPQCVKGQVNNQVTFSLNTCL